MDGGSNISLTYSSLLTQTECLKITTSPGSLSIGIPKERNVNEKRLTLSPDAVSVLIANGHEIIIESNAGEGAHYSDQKYAEVGAKIAFNAKDVYAQPIILKVEPPTLEEINLLNTNTFLISGLQINLQKKEYFEQLANKKITALAFDYIKNEHDQLPVLRLLSEIAGTTSILIAAQLMSTDNGGNGLMMGGVAGVRPTEVVVIGGGTVGEYAIRSALGLGAIVRVFDQSASKLRRLQNDIGQRISTSTIDPKELEKSLMRCDVAIGAMRGEIRTPIVVTESMVEKMKPGAIIIDVSINNGGCFETSRATTNQHPTFVKHGVIHYGVPNMTSKVARTATKALSNFFLSYLVSIGDEGGFEPLLRKDKGLRQGIYMYKGRVTKLQVSQWFQLPYHDINLLIC